MWEEDGKDKLPKKKHVLIYGIVKKYLMLDYIRKFGKVSNERMPSILGIYGGLEKGKSIQGGH